MNWFIMLIGVLYLGAAIEAYVTSTRWPFIAMYVCYGLSSFAMAYAEKLKDAIH